MSGLIAKLILCPLILWLSDLFLWDIFYPFLYQTIIVGVVLAAAAHLIDVLVLKRGTLWISLGLEFIAFIVIVYFSHFFFPNARVTLAGALAAAIFLGISEYLQHRFLIGYGKTKKAP